jgi:hypothetical protein
MLRSFAFEVRIKQDLATLNGGYADDSQWFELWLSEVMPGAGNNHKYAIFGAKLYVAKSGVAYNRVSYPGFTTIISR